jgi:hypothetical protein
MKAKVENPDELLFLNDRKVYFKTKDPYDFSIINWDLWSENESLTKEELFEKYSVNRNEINVGMFIFEVLLHSDFASDVWHVMVYNCEHEILNGEHVFIYKLNFTRKRKKNWRNPLHIFGLGHNS